MSHYILTLVSRDELQSGRYLVQISIVATKSLNTVLKNSEADGFIKTKPLIGGSYKSPAFDIRDKEKVHVDVTGSLKPLKKLVAGQDVLEYSRGKGDCSRQILLAVNTADKTLIGDITFRKNDKRGAFIHQVQIDVSSPPLPGATGSTLSSQISVDGGPVSVEDNTAIPITDTDYDLSKNMGAMRLSEKEMNVSPSQRDQGEISPGKTPLNLPFPTSRSEDFSSDSFSTLSPTTPPISHPSMHHSYSAPSVLPPNPNSVKGVLSNNSLLKLGEQLGPQDAFRLFIELNTPHARIQTSLDHVHARNFGRACMDLFEEWSQKWPRTDDGMQKAFQQLYGALHTIGRVDLAEVLNSAGSENRQLVNEDFV